MRLVRYSSTMLQVGYPELEVDVASQPGCLNSIKQMWTTGFGCSAVPRTFPDFRSSTQDGMIV